MEIIQYSNGPEGAENPSKELIEEFCRDYAFSNSRGGYYMTIANFFGCDKLVGPVVSSHGGDEYKFDFRDPSSGRMFKIFRAQDLSEYEKYLAYGGKVTILVNVQDSYWDQSQFVDRENLLLTLPDENEQQIRQESTLLYSYGHLWEFDHLDENSRLVWRMVEPRTSDTTVEQLHEA